jgi:8-oxo-dGTP pyrophosphatase MutT (NUDIX family)
MRAARCAMARQTCRKPTPRFDIFVETVRKYSGVIGPSLPDVEVFLRRRIAEPLPGVAAQRRFTPSPWLADWSPDRLPDAARHAAALILLYPAAGGLVVPLTVRHRGLPQHAGQISLPGGAIDPGESAEAAALREAEEEIGVAADHVRLLGALSTLWVAVSNFVVHPFVGVTDDPPVFRLHPAEVEALVEAPLAGLRDPARLRWTRREHAGQHVRYPYFDVAGQVVWGATAMMLGEFACLFDAELGPLAPE